MELFSESEPTFIIVSFPLFICLLLFLVVDFGSYLLSRLFLCLCRLMSFNLNV